VILVLTQQPDSIQAVNRLTRLAPAPMTKGRTRRKVWQSIPACLIDAVQKKSNRSVKMTAAVIRSAVLPGLQTENSIDWQGTGLLYLTAIRHSVTAGFQK
jgi:hypothetical protein